MLKFKNNSVGLPDFDSIKLDIELLKLKLIDERFEDGIIGYKHHMIDLRCLESISVLNETPNYTERVEEAVKQAKSERDNNIVAGALVGGILDAGLGDDSIIDGVVLGGLVGAASSPDYISKIDITEDSVVDVLLGFKGGSSLALKADKDGVITILQLVNKLRSTSKDDVPSNMISQVPLTTDEIKIAEESALTSLKNSHFNITHFMFVIGCLAAFVVSAYAIGDSTFSSLGSALSPIKGTDTDSHHITNYMMKYFVNFYWGIYLSILSASWIRSRITFNSALQNGEGKPERVAV